MNILNEVIKIINVKLDNKLKWEYGMYYSNIFEIYIDYDDNWDEFNFIWCNSQMKNVIKRIKYRLFKKDFDIIESLFYETKTIIEPYFEQNLKIKEKVDENIKSYRDEYCRLCGEYSWINSRYEHDFTICKNCGRKFENNDM